MPVRGRRVLVRRLAVFMRRNGVRLRLFVLAAIVVMGRLIVVVSGGLMFGGGVMMMLAGRMLGLRHGVFLLALAGEARLPCFVAITEKR
jgi:LytS/YehU family sensor histidine kinase